MFINEVNTSMALAFGCCYLFGGIEKKGKQKANQKWRISERLHFSGSLSAFFFWKPKAGCYLNFVQLFYIAKSMSAGLGKLVFGSFTF